MANGEIFILIITMFIFLASINFSVVQDLNYINNCKNINFNWNYLFSFLSELLIVFVLLPIMDPVENKTMIFFISCVTSIFTGMIIIYAIVYAIYQKSEGLILFISIPILIVSGIIYVKFIFDIANLYKTALFIYGLVITGLIYRIHFIKSSK